MSHESVRFVDSADLHVSSNSSLSVHAHHVMTAGPPSDVSLGRCQPLSPVPDLGGDGSKPRPLGVLPKLGSSS